MSEANDTKRNILVDCWQSFRALPLWVQIWVAFILMPINMATVFFLDQPSGALVAILAISAMMLNLPVMLYDRGFSKLMAVPHLLPWTVLVIFLIGWRPEGSVLYGQFLNILIATNIISLLFDYTDAIAWLNGNREVAGR